VIKKMTSLILSILILLIVLNALFYLKQPSMIFFPSDNLDATPEQWGMPFENIHFSAADGTSLNGWYIPHSDSDRVLLFFHGNAGNISHRSESIAVFHRMGLNIFIFDYRGYGHSSGKVNEKGLYQDADAAWNYLTKTKDIDSRKIILFGRSLGGAIAANLANKNTPAALIMESTFSSSRDMASSIIPYLSNLIIMRYQFNSKDKIANIQCPVMIMHSSEDEMIPYSHGKKLFNAANQPREFFRMKGSHNAGFLLSQPDYEVVIESFINTYVNN